MRIDLFVLTDTTYIRMFVLDEADEMLSRGFKDQIYEVFTQLKHDNLQVNRNHSSCCHLGHAL